MINDHYKRNLVITATDNTGVVKNIVITPDNEIYKTPPMCVIRDAKVRDKKTPLQYLTQEEIERDNLFEILKLLEVRLKGYNKYILLRDSEISSKKNWHSTTEAGTLYHCDYLIQSIRNRYAYFKTNMLKYSSSSIVRKEFKEQNSLQTYDGFPYLLMKNVCPDGKSIFLGYPKVHGKEVVKILVLNGDEIRKTFLIKDNKILKFKAKNLFSRAHFDRNLYYYTQDEIQKLHFEYYLKIIDRYLEKVNAQIQEKLESKLSKKG